MNYLASRRSINYRPALLFLGVLLAAIMVNTKTVSASTVTLEPTRDTYVDSSMPDLGNGSIGLGVVKHQPSDDSSSLVLLHFDVSSIPAGSVISSAKVSIRLGGCINSTAGSGHISLAGYLANGSPTWTESSTYGQLSTSGSSIDGFGSQIISCSPGSRYELDIAPIISYWVDGVFPNDGMVIGRINGGDYWTRVFYMSEAAAGSRPVLTVNYEVPYESVPTPDGPPAASSSDSPATTKKTESGPNTVVAESSPEPLAPDTSIASPTKLTAKQVTGKTDVSVSWQASTTSDIELYRVYRKVAGQSTYTKIAELSKTQLSYVDTKTTASKQHSYFVRAVRSSKESLNSPVVSIVPQAKVASKVVTTTKQASRLSWLIAGILTVLLLAALVAYKLLHTKHKKLHAAHKEVTKTDAKNTDG